MRPQPKKYVCSSCGLIFIPEETPHRFNPTRNKCVRCILDKKQEKDPIALPPCYGVKYDGASAACVQICEVSQECLIQMIDTRSVDMALDLDSMHKRRHGQTNSYNYHAVRILRSVGRPMHLIDLIPIVEKLSESRGVPRERRLRRAMVKSPDIVCLGDNFFCWVGIWDSSSGGQVGYRDIYERSSGITPVTILVKRFKEKKNGSGDT